MARPLGGGRFLVQIAAVGHHVFHDLELDSADEPTEKRMRNQELLGAKLDGFDEFPEMSIDLVRPGGLPSFFHLFSSRFCPSSVES